MGFYPQKQRSAVALYKLNTIESGGTLDIKSGASFKIAGVTVSPSARLNLNNLTSQAMTADGAVTVKNGVVTLNKAGVLAATLADPVVTTDEFQRLVITSLTAQAHTVTIAGGIAGGAGATDVATFGGAIGNSVQLIAFNGKWHCAGVSGVTFG